MSAVDDAIREAQIEIERTYFNNERAGYERVVYVNNLLRDLVETVQRSQRSQWREMDSAPKDGTEILILTPEQYARSVAWDCGGWWLGDLNYEATHWMPIPAPPQTREET